MDLKGIMLSKQSQFQYIPQYVILFIKHSPNGEMKEGKQMGGFQGREGARQGGLWVEETA